MGAQGGLKKKGERFHFYRTHDSGAKGKKDDIKQHQESAK